MPSEQRLHPAAILFDLGRQLRNFALPGIFLLFTSSRGSSMSGPFPGVPGWSAWMLLLILPAMAVSVARFLSFRLRYDEHELVIRQGLVFRSERHVPYTRIQNLDAVQNLVHRLCAVVEVRIETGGGSEAEASIRVLPMSAYHEMRRRVFAGREAALPGADAIAAATGAPLAETTTILRLAPRDLMLYGFIESRGMVLIGAIYGALWEMGLLNGFWDRVPGAQRYGRSAVRSMLTSLFGQGTFPLQLLLVAIGGLIAVLVAVRVASMLWAAIRLHDFTVTRAGDDLRTQYGLFTRVSATIPLHHVQTVTVRDSLVHRWLGRTSVRVETAGSQVEGDDSGDRLWLAPLIRRSELRHLLGHVIPFDDPDAVAWRPVHPRAFARAVKPALAVAVAACVVLSPLLGWWTLATLPVTGTWAVFVTRRRVARLGWIANDDVVAFRRGWLWRQVTIARVTKLQAVAVHESPFDRRHRMASVRIDTAGASAAQRIDIPYLDDAVARPLHQRLAAQAAETEFRW
jgi:putative membrane protein